MYREQRVPVSQQADIHCVLCCCVEVCLNFLLVCCRRALTSPSWQSILCAVWCWLHRCQLKCGGETGCHWSAR